MIDITIEGIKKKIWVPTTIGSPVKIEQPTGVFSMVKSIFSESNRRDNIVKQMAASCPYKVGDTVKICDTKEEKMFGKQLMVLSIADSYTKLGKTEKWPKTDKPMIVHVKSHDKKLTFFCTPDYIEKTGAI